jgi:hypothetical protein
VQNQTARRKQRSGDIATFSVAANGFVTRLGYSTIVSP